LECVPSSKGPRHLANISIAVVSIHLCHHTWPPYLRGVITRNALRFRPTDLFDEQLLGTTIFPLGSYHTTATSRISTVAGCQEIATSNSSTEPRARLRYEYYYSSHQWASWIDVEWSKRRPRGVVGLATASNLGLLAATKRQALRGS